MPQRGYKGMSGYKDGQKIFGNFIKIGLIIGSEILKENPRKKAQIIEPADSTESEAHMSSGCIVTIILMILFLILIVYLIFNT